MPTTNMPEPNISIAKIPVPETIKKYYPLGNKTLFMLIFKKTAVFFFLAPLLIFSLIALSYVPSEYIDSAITIILGYFAILLVILGLVFLFGWLEYSRYGITIGDKDLKISKGIISTEQIGIPYKHVQDIKIKRSLIDQITGVSDIVIMILGPDDSRSTALHTREDMIILKSLSKEIAVEIQDAVLRKAQVEQINVLSGQAHN